MEFHKGNFVVHKSGRSFSAVAIDRAHEQNNAIIKGDVGAIGLTEDPIALRRWMVAGPEVSRIVAAYEAVSGVNNVGSNKHHDQTLSAQIAFFEKVEALRKVYQGIGNPFQEESADLLVLDTKNIADTSCAVMIGTHHKRGKEQFQAFMDGLKENNGCTFYQPIKKNRVSYFKHERVHQRKIC